jgi:predicted GNAT superfamily acetyltransferase
MPETRPETASPEHTAAQAAFLPERFGFRPHRHGWLKEFDGLGTVAVVPLGWPHAQAPSYDLADGERVAMDPLNLVVWLQARVWGMPPELLVPSNVLAIIPDTGGSVLAAYELTKGFNGDGWLGFIIGLGARSGTLVSHMLGVREDARGTKDLGWYLKLIQGYEALRSGHHAMIWTFDPMRGINARLNMEKLGTTVEDLTLDKYGVLRTTLYGEVPSDRFTAHWDLTAPRTLERIARVHDGSYRGLSPADVADLPEATPRTLAGILETRPERVRYRIPGDIDRLMEADPQAAIRWREEMREVVAALMTTKRARFDDETGDGPLAAGYEVRPGDYVITGFASGADAAGERISYYVLERKRGKSTT